MRSSALLLRRVTVGASVSHTVTSPPSSPLTLSASSRSTSSTSTAVKSPFALAPPRHRHQRRASPSPVSAASTTPASPDEEAFARFAESQRKLPRPSLAEEARTILSSAGTAVLSTVDAGAAGHPAGSVVQFAIPAAAGCSAVVALSSMSSHTRDLATDPRCSLTVLAPGFKGMEDSRVSLTCVAKKLSSSGSGATSAAEGGEAAAARAAFKQRHPDAFWVDFGDFSWWRLDPIGSGDEGRGPAGASSPPSSAPPPPPAAARVVAGFGRAGSVSADELSSASPDPVAAFSAPVSGHMNADHADAVLAVARSSVAGLGERIAAARMGRVDRLGFEVELVLAPSAAEGEGKPATGERLTARIPFPEPAEDRKSLKERLVEMTRAAAAPSAAKSG